MILSIIYLIMTALIDEFIPISLSNILTLIGLDIIIFILWFRRKNG